jgi:hypothetical protein
MITVINLEVFSKHRLLYRDSYLRLCSCSRAFARNIDVSRQDAKRKSSKVQRTTSGFEMDNFLPADDELREYD